jgi:hypothetical protein
MSKDVSQVCDGYSKTSLMGKRLAQKVTSRQLVRGEDREGAGDQEEPRCALRKK